MNRRIFLGSTLTALNIPLALALGLLKPTKALADWPKDVFVATVVDDALGRISGGSPITPSDAIEIQAKEIAEDGSSVPVTLRSRIPGTRSIALLSEKNPNPAVARFTLNSRVAPVMSTRIRMGGTGDIIAVVEADGGYYVARKHVRVTVGGCAG